MPEIDYTQIDFGAWSLLPPLAAIVLAVWWRNVLPALFAGIWIGTTILAEGNPWEGFLILFDKLAVPELADADHITIILFTTFLGAMVGTMTHSGGSAALVDRIARKIHSRQGGQLMTWLAGLVVFFDDYANALLIGGTMRPVTDRMRISRVKLAFLVDATAAPVAGLAVISTWAVYEMEQIAVGYQQIQQEVVPYAIFLETIPYRFYPIFMLLFVFLIGLTGRDFGSMLQREEESLNADEPLQEQEHADARIGLIRHALIPLSVLLISAGVGFVRDFDHSARVLLISSFLASVAGVLSMIAWKTHSLEQALDSWVEGAKSMFPAMMVLSMAWMISAVCDPTHLDTAGYLVSQLGDSLPASSLPAVSFLLSAGVAFATGSSWATMGLLIPLLTTLTWGILSTGGVAVSVHDPILLASIGSVLAGSIFGDHCSPISDTTVLSSAAADCNHLDHVATQLPYAICVGAVTLCLGCIPVGLGMNVWLTLVLQGIGTVAAVFLLGRLPGAGQRAKERNAPVVPVLAVETSE